MKNTKDFLNSIDAEDDVIDAVYGRNVPIDGASIAEGIKNDPVFKNKIAPVIKCEKKRGNCWTFGIKGSF